MNRDSIFPKRQNSLYCIIQSWFLHVAPKQKVEQCIQYIGRPTKSESKSPNYSPGDFESTGEEIMKFYVIYCRLI